MRKLQGKIVSDKMAKTRVVEIEHWRKNQRYLKYHKVMKRFKAHDEKSEYRIGDEVIIQEIRPMSKEKRWRIIAKV